MPYVSGGLSDQPYALMNRIKSAVNVYEAIREYRASKDRGSLQAQEPGLWSVVEEVVMLREEIARNG